MFRKLSQEPLCTDPFVLNLKEARKKTPLCDISNVLYRLYSVQEPGEFVTHYNIKTKLER
jgi:hypothetical protein